MGKCSIEEGTMQGSQKVTVMVTVHDLMMKKWLNGVGEAFKLEFKGNIFENMLLN